MNVLESTDKNCTALIEEFAFFLELFGLAFWIEVITVEPECTYYFGPFINAWSAQEDISGYIEDLEQENAQVISVKIKQCQPNQLTIDMDESVRDIDSSI